MTRQRFDESRYDSPAPWWFRNTIWLVLPFSVALSTAVAYRSVPAFMAVLVLLLGLGIVVLAWERKHRTR